MCGSSFGVSVGCRRKKAPTGGASTGSKCDVLDSERLDGISLPLLADGMIGLNVLLAARWMQDGFAEPIDKVVRTNLLPYQGLMHLAKHNSTTSG